MATSKILSLEAEVLANVLEYIDDESPHTTAAVAQTCKHFHFVAKLVRYRRLTIRWDQNLASWVDLAGRKQEEWETPDLLQGLRQLTVCRGELNALPVRLDSPSTRALCDCLNRLTSVVRSASNLKTLVWKAGFLPTEEIIETLQAHQPNVKLELYRAKRLANEDRPLKLEKALSTAACLTTFSMSTTPGTRTQDHMLFQMILGSAPNLKFASLVSTPMMTPNIPEAGSLPPNFESWFPQDQKTKKLSPSLRHLTLDGWELSAECLDYWSQYVNFTSLKSLKCSRGPVNASFFQRASQVLTNLQSISINLGPSTPPSLRPPNMAFFSAPKHYIATCPPLSNLSLWSWRGKVPLSTILDQHGATLQELQLHEREDSGGFFLRDPFSVEELQSIRQSCPHLKVLTVDLNKASRCLRVQDYEGIMDELAKFKLDKLQIYMDSGLLWFRRRAQLEHPSSHNLTQNHPQINDDQTAPLEDVNLPSGCNGDFDFAGAVPLTVTRPEPAWNHLLLQDESIIVQPPSTHQDICRFLIKTWKIIFGSKTTGPRRLDLKFGEWESLARHIVPGEGGNARDIRVWCRARPHERDDMVGECAVEFDCCAGRHSRKFASR